MADATVPATRRNTRPAPPPPGRNMTVRMTHDLHDDLAVLMQHGDEISTIVRDAVRHMADAHRRARDYDDTPHPRIVQAIYAGETLPCGHRAGGSHT